MAIKCPLCGLFSPDSAARCDCGFDFASKRVERSYAKPGDPTILAARGMTLTQVGVRNIERGAVVCAVGAVLTVLGLWNAAVGGGAIIFWGAIVFGAAQMFRGVGQYSRGKKIDQ